MSHRNLDEMRGGADADDSGEELQYGLRNTRRQMAYEHRGTSSLTPAQVMDQQTHYGYAWLSLLQALQVFQLVLLLLASFSCLRWYVDGVGNSISILTTNMICSKMQSIKEYVEMLLFHFCWILAHGEIAFLYAEDLSIYVRR
jgi:hypothetical protein